MMTVEAKTTKNKNNSSEFMWTS